MVGVARLNLKRTETMNLDKLKEFLGKLSVHDLPLAAVVLGGIILLVLVFKSGKFLMKLVFLLIAVGLFAGAYWWHFHKAGGL